MEPDVHDPPGQPVRAGRGDDPPKPPPSERKGSRSLFAKFPSEESRRAADNPGSSDTGRAGGMEPASDTTQDEGSAGTDGASKVNMAKTAPRSLRKGPSLFAGQGAEVPDQRPRAQRKSNRVMAKSLNARSLTSRPLVNPHLRSDPRLRTWITRAIVALVLLIGFTIGLNWRIGLTAAVIYVAADSIFRSKTTAVVPAGVRVTSAQRFTRRRLRVLQPAGYMSLHARSIPGTKHVIDHVVVGPAGVFTLDSQRLDRRLPLRAVGGMLYHGKESMEGRFDHATHESKHAAQLIAAELGQRVRVRPGMVLYGPSTPWVIMKFNGVDVFDGSRIGTFFRRQTRAVGKHGLNASQIAMVLAAAARALPPLE